MRLLLAAILLAIAVPASAQIYQYIDQQGNRVYTDQPPEGIDATSVELPTVNTVDMQPPADNFTDPSLTADSDLDADAEPAIPYSTLELTGLPDDQAIRANNGDFTVQVAINPELASQDRLQLLVDGQAYGPAGHSTTINVINLSRGEHQLAVQVLSSDNQVLQTSAAQTVAIQRVHLGDRKPRPRSAP